jgi:hypothetical protein
VVTNTSVIVISQGSSGTSSTSGAISHKATVDGFGVRFPSAGIATRPLESWCCSPDFSSLSLLAPVAATVGIPWELDVHTPPLDTLVIAGGVTVPLDPAAVQAGALPPNAVFAHGGMDGARGLSAPTVLTSAGNVSGSSNWTPPGTPESVPEPSTFLLLVSGFAGFGLWRRNMSKR